MRTDQKAKLASIFDALIDVAVIELDPVNWPGVGLLPMEMSKEDRGDRFWCNKDAAATLTLINKIDSIQEGFIPDDGENLERMIRNAEKQASAIVARVMEKQA